MRGGGLFIGCLTKGRLGGGRATVILVVALCASLGSCASKLPKPAPPVSYTHLTLPTIYSV